jgi:NAD(P)-dependent dehydrogenase (short-subunit alcohol dehydrogenase family)
VADGAERAVSGPLALVTGATSGIGEAAAAALARAGWGVVVHGRGERSAAEACARIGREVPGARLWPVHADLASLAQVDALVANVAGRLDALVNNAGLFTPNAREHERRRSADGYELTWAVNYLAAFALTTGLAGRVGAVVNVGSGMLARAELRWPDLQHERDWNRAAAYGQSKLALTMFTAELAARGSRAYAVNPGYTDTRLVREGYGGPAAPAADAAAWVVRPLLADVAGVCFELGEPADPHPLIHDAAARARLWDESRRQVDRVLTAVPGPAS